jgi:hypothetical protein
MFSGFHVGIIIADFRVLKTCICPAPRTLNKQTIQKIRVKLRHVHQGKPGVSSRSPWQYLLQTQQIILLTQHISLYSSWRQHCPPKRWRLPIRLQGVNSKCCNLNGPHFLFNISIYTVRAARTNNLDAFTKITLIINIIKKTKVTTKENARKICQNRLCCLYRQTEGKWKHVELEEKLKRKRRRRRKKKEGN